jgi:PAS domain S-box-containing protein
MPSTRRGSDDAAALSRVVRDAAALSTLAATWAGASPRRIVESLADFLVATGRAAVVYVKTPDTEVGRARGHGTAGAVESKLRDSLAPWLAGDGRASPVAHPLADGKLEVVRIALGSPDRGWLVVGAPVSGFPSQADRLLFDIAADRVALALERQRAGDALQEGARTQRDLTVQYAVAAVLAGSATLREAAPQILRVLSERGGWELGAVWEVDEPAGVIRCSDVWHMDGLRVAEFERASRSHPQSPGVGIPGRVWSSGKSVWIADVHDDRNFPRARYAAEAGLHSAIAFPIQVADQVTGVIEFFSRDVRPPDREVLEMFQAVGIQVGQFVERRRAEAGLRRREHELTEFLETATLGLHWVGPDGRILWANRAELEMLGYEREDYVGRHVADFHVDRVVVDDLLRCLERGDALHDREARVRRKDGAIADVLISAAVHAGSDGHTHLRCFTRDITDRKRAEEARQATEERFRRLAATIPSLIWTATADGIVTYANERWYDYTGTAPGDDTTDWPERVLHPDDRARRQAEWDRALATGTTYEIEVRNRRRDGAYRWFLSRAVPIRNAGGQIVAWFGVSTDIDDQKRAEQERARLFQAERAARAEAEAAQQRYQQLVDGLDAIVWEADARRSRFTFMSRRAEQILGYPVERWLGQPDFWVGVVHPDDRDWAVTLTHAHTAECRDHDFEYRAVTATGRELWLRDLVYVVRGADGKAERLRGIMVDVTERRHAEQALKDADRRKDEFLATLAHELRNPLAPLRNGLEILRLGGGARDPERVYEIMDRQVQHMVRLVDDLLELSRITRGMIELRKERLDVATAVQDAVDTNRSLIEAAGHQLTVSLPSEPLPIDADPVRLAQVIGNLLNNAAKYTDRGGHIWLSAERRGAHVVVRVRDDGIGIAPDMLPHIFEMFIQGHRSRRPAQGGLGIGLSLVETLVKMHGGTVSARSDGLGRGSEFTVRLPLAVSAARGEATEHDSVVAPAAGAKRRVLVVDDNQDAAESLGMLLTLLGCDVRLAYDGPSALDTIRSHRPTMVLLDLGMPGMSGLEVAAHVRQQPELRDVFLAALTGWGREEDRTRSRAAGFDHHLTKPVSAEALQALLAEIEKR